jgi:A/G-specific adenine glycosylase
MSGDRLLLRRSLLDWYDRARRRLPWRAPPGVRADPYRVWISEIMLQQTTVAAVRPYFEAFMSRWPDVRALAAAEEADVLHAWQGLGYYARARNLHRCARHLMAEHEGRFPGTEQELRRLPGVGAYTAAAIAAIAFDACASPVDGNIARVVARLHALEEPLPQARPTIEALARDLTPDARAGDFAQAMMDLGATVCLPRRPLCGACPWSPDCAAFRSGRPEAYPRRAPKPDRPARIGVVFWLEQADGAVLLRRRPPHGLLGGMMEFPSTPWRERPWTVDEAAACAPAAVRWRAIGGEARHVFTHFRLTLSVLAGRTAAADGIAGLWCRPEGFGGQALPTVMKKVIRLVRSAADDQAS